MTNQLNKVVRLPSEALEMLADRYDAHRFVATMTVTAKQTLELLLEYERLMGEAERAIDFSRSQSDGEMANQWRHVEVFIHALRDELRMWLFLKERDANRAWTSFVYAEGGALAAQRAIPDYGPARRLVEHLTMAERVLFPEQRFFSPSMIISEQDIECSICRGLGGECSHIPGETYDGVVAHRVVHRIKGAREISLVKEPASKHARALNFGGMDLLTGQKFKRSKRTTKRRRKR